MKYLSISCPFHIILHPNPKSGGVVLDTPPATNRVNLLFSSVCSLLLSEVISSFHLTIVKKSSSKVCLIDYCLTSFRTWITFLFCSKWKMKMRMTDELWQCCQLTGVLVKYKIWVYLGTKSLQIRFWIILWGIKSQIMVRKWPSN